MTVPITARDLSPDIAGMSRVDPSDVGLDLTRLRRVEDHFARYLNSNLLTSWHVTVARAGQIAYSSGAGLADRENNRPIAHDSIWRIFSMTKPVTAVAALMLWEEGKFEMRDPVSKFIPSFGESQVWRSGTSVEPELESQTEPMQMWHLFTHTAGLTYGFMYSHPVDELYRRAGMEWGFPSELDLAGVCDLLAAQPLLFQPGAEWNYSTSIDVLGRVVEILSGQQLGTFFQERIFGPLGMTDTAFAIPESKGDRAAALYYATPGTLLAARNEGADKRIHVEPKAHGGGGGLFSTMADYVRFAEMLRRGGEFNGRRLLSPRTVSYMASNHLPRNADLTEFGRPLFAETTYDGIGFGLGVSVTLDPVANKAPGSVGDFGWGGAASTWFLVDPVEDITLTFMTQLMPSSTHPLRSQLKQLLHQSLVD
jgi:CubicO group peptidase (beta-lactamase class C family)